MVEYRGRHARQADDGALASTAPQNEHGAKDGTKGTGQQSQSVTGTVAPSPLSHPLSHKSQRPSSAPKVRKGHYRSAHESILESNQPKRHSKRKTVAILVPILIVIALLVGGGMFVYTQFFSSPEVTAGQTVSVTIPEGVATSQIAQILKKADVVSDEQAFIKDVQDRGAAALLKPGSYKLVTLMDTEQLINTLISGPDIASTDAKLTIAEGLTVEQTAKVVASTCKISEQDFILLAYSADQYLDKYPFLAGVYNNSMEGFLYPKTYSIPEGSSADYVIRVLLDQFAKETSNIDYSYAVERNLTIADVVTIASLIERETKANAERELVASVIYNRLHEDMRLQIDASVVYALGPGYDGHPLLLSDLEVDSPYNTYKIAELPAGPICSPRIESIQAAAHPANTNYFYYVLTDKEGFHTFCETFDEFEDAKLVYQELFGIG